MRAGSDADIGHAPCPSRRNLLGEASLGRDNRRDNQHGGSLSMPVTIYHNPRCNTSRKTLALLRDKGVEPTVVEYLKTPYTAAQLSLLLGQLKLPAKAVIRKKEAAEAGIDPAKLSEDQMIAAMAKNPIIVERPIVVSGGKAALGRPPEAVLKVL